MLTIRIPSIGEILVYMETILYDGESFSIKGKGDNGEIYDVFMSRISMQDDFHREYGYVHVIGYNTNKHFTACNHYTSIG